MPAQFTVNRPYLYLFTLNKRYRQVSLIQRHIWTYRLQRCYRHRQGRRSA